MSEVEERMRAALELRDLMIAMRREALKRAFPSESEAEIEGRLTRWVLTPPRRVKSIRDEVSCQKASKP